MRDDTSTVQRWETLRRLARSMRIAAYSKEEQPHEEQAGSGEPEPPRRRGGRLAGSTYLIVLVLVALLLVVVSVSRSVFGPAPRANLVVGSLPFWNFDNGTQTLVANKESINEVSPWMYGISGAGEITTQYPPHKNAMVDGEIAKLRQAGFPLVPTLANITDGLWAYEPVARMLHDPDRMQRHVNDIVALVNRENYAGIDIDYENLRADDRAAFSMFISKLGDTLHSNGKVLSVALFAKTSDAGYDERNVAQDYAAIGRVADEVRLMGYDFHWATSQPGPVAPIEWIRDVLRYAKSEIPPDRIVLGVPLYGYDWVDGQGSSVTWLQAFRLARDHNAQVQYDVATQTPWFRYTAADGREHMVWFENTESSRAKFEAAQGSGIRGVYLWMFGYEQDGTWPELRKSLPVRGR